jgi:hypothetical protein
MFLLGLLAFVLFAGSSTLTAAMWALGAGVNRAFHNLMGWAFVAVHVTCLAMGGRAFLTKEGSTVVMYSVIPFPISLGILAAGMFACTFLARC